VSNEQKKIKVLIADDSAFMRKILSDIVNSDIQLEVVAVAKNGEEAYQKTIAYKPDVITLDIEMPVMDGLTTLGLIMEKNPVPVIMFSALTQEGALSTIRALEKGAVDFIAKPGGSISAVSVDLGQEIINKIKIAAGISLRKIKLPQIKTIPEIKPEAIKPSDNLSSIGKQYSAVRDRNAISLIVIGTSTGGPKALHEVMSGLARIPRTAILIVQHMPPGFTKSLAHRLDSVAKYRVKEAEQGEEVVDGNAYIAPGGYHMEAAYQFDKLKIQLSQAPLVNGHRPSVDVLMKSVAAIELQKVGVIMTGMGNDGAEGIKLMKDYGAVNIGESAETCVVYGMPKSAAQLGALDYEVPVDRIAGFIEKAIRII